MYAFVMLGVVFPYQVKRLARGTSPKWAILCRVGRKTTTQSVVSVYHFNHWWWWWRICDNVYCAEGSRSSPSLASIPAKVVRSADSRSQQLRRIVVVAEGQPSRPAVDADVRRLSAVPAFTPLLHGTVSLSEDTVSSRPPQLDARHVLALCTRYQDHLHQCAEAVAFDQNALCVRIKEVSHVLTF